MEPRCTAAGGGTALGGTGMNLSLELLRAEAAVTGFRLDMLEKVAHPPGQAVGQHRAGAVPAGGVGDPRAAAAAATVLYEKPRDLDAADPRSLRHRVSRPGLVCGGVLPPAWRREAVSSRPDGGGGGAADGVRAAEELLAGCVLCRQLADRAGGDGASEAAVCAGSGPLGA